MNNNTKWLLCALLSLGSFGACDNKNDDPFPPEPEKGAVTYIYMAQVDQNIRQDAISGLEELKTSCTPSHRAVSAINFDKHIRDSLGIAGTVYCYFDGGKEQIIKESDKVDQLGATSTYLTEMINLSLKLAPADRYVLILNGHGGGWDNIDAADPVTRSTMVGEDEMGEGLTVNRIQKGIKESELYKSGGKIDLIYFDACLMGTVEYMCELDDVANYAIATSTLSYTMDQKVADLIAQMKKPGNPESHLQDFCTICNGLWERGGGRAVLHCVRLDKMAAVARTMGEISDFLINKCSASEDTKNRVRAIRSQTANMWWDENCTLPLYDLGDYLFRIASAIPTPEYKALLQKYHDTSAAALVYSDSTQLVNSCKKAGNLAPGNDRYSLSVLLSRISAKDESPFLGTAYKTLKMQTVGKWETYLRYINSADSRIPNDY